MIFGEDDVGIASSRTATGVGIAAVLALAVVAVAAARPAKSLPTCPRIRTVVQPLVRRSLPITGDVIGQGDLGPSVTCNYVPTLSIEFQPGVGVGLFDSDRASTPKSKKLTGLGSRAFTALLSISTGKTKPAYYEVEVLQGATVFKIISADSALATDELLARKLLPLA